MTGNGSNKDFTPASSKAELPAVFPGNPSQLVQVLSRLPAAVYTCDKEGRITFYNARAAELWGRDPELFSCSERFCGSWKAFTMGGHRLKREETPMAVALQTGQRFQNVEAMLERPDGARLICSISIDPLYDEEGTITGAVNVFQDVTASRRAEQALRSKEAQLRLITDHAPAMIVHCDRAHRYLFANRVYAERFHLHPHELVGKHVSEVVGKAGYAKFAHYMDRALAGETMEFEELIPYDVIGPQWVLARYAPDRDEQGNVKGLVAVITDITEPKRLEQARNQLENRYQAFMEQASDGILIFDRDGYFVSANPALCVMLGYTADELPGLRVQDTYLPEELEIAEQRLRTLRTGQPVRFERQMRRKDGTFVDVEASIRMVPEGLGQAIIRDVSQRKKAENELKNFQWLAENSSEFIGISDLELRPFFVNKAGLQMVGLESLQQAKTVSVQQFFFPEDQERIQVEFFREVLKKGTGTIEIRFRHFKTGEALWMIYNVSVLKNVSGHPIAFATISQNITERKRVELALAEQARLLDLSFDTIFVRDVDDRISYWNHGAEKLYGWTREDVVGRHVHTILQTEFPMPLPIIMEEFHRHGRWEGELKHTRRDGQKVTVLTRWALDRDKNGNPAAILETNSDITERKRAEEALKQSEAEFRQLADSMPQVVWSARSDGTIDYYNRRWFELTGAAVGDRDWLTFLHPEDKEAASIEWALAVEERRPFQMEYRYHSAKSGEYIWHLGRGVPIKSVQGEVVRWYCTATDISELKNYEATLRESRERLAAALRAAGTGTFRWNIRSNEVSFDEALERMFGMADGEKVDSLGKALSIIHPGDRDRFLVSASRCASEGADFSLEYRVVWRDGSVHWIDDRGKTFFDEEGRPTYMMGACVDITERKRIEEDLRQAQNQLERHARELESHVEERTARLRETIAELEAFSYTISHDLRAPLRSMHGFSQLLVEEYGNQLDATGKDYLRRITAASSRLDKFIQDVLTYSKIPKMELQLVPVDLHALVHELSEQYPSFQLPHARIEISGLLPKILGQRSSLTQCISNFIGNAVKFVAPGVTPHVVLHAQQRGDKVRVCISDNGIGIAESDCSKIWGIFERLHPTKKYEGTGIGLAIVRKTIEKMGGSVGVESREGSGSTFWFELPRA